METKIKLTKRQYDLRRYLWNHRTEWKSSKELFDGVYGYEKANTAYKQINEDVKRINVSGIFDKKIITNRVKGYKLATKKEFEEWAKQAVIEAKKKIKYVYDVIGDAKLDGQGIIPGLEGFDREFYEKFVREETANG